jgi:hypothetical protein
MNVLCYIRTTVRSKSFFDEEFKYLALLKIKWAAEILDAYKINDIYKLKKSVDIEFSEYDAFLE